MVYDYAVLGCGLCGIAAALTLAKGNEKVVLMGERGDIAWELGRSFVRRSGECEEPSWLHVRARAAEAGYADETGIDGAAGEIILADELVRAGVVCAFMYWPIACELADNGLVGLLCGAKDGVRRIRARRWIDASEQGVLGRQIGRASCRERV
jgi:hypothetical protein